MKGIARVVVVGDVHAGSVFAPIPRDFTTLEGNEVKPNLLQQFLLNRWERWTHEDLPAWLGKAPFALIVNGDATEGIHHGTKEVISPDPADHLECAVQMLEPLAKLAAKVFVVEGTECHTGHLEHALAKRLKAVPDPNTGKAAWPKLHLTVAGVPCVWHHHIGTTSRAWLEASALSINLANEQVIAARSGHPVPLVLGTAHRHTFGVYRGAAGLCIAGPAWQGLTRHARKVVPSAITIPGSYGLDYSRKGEIPQVTPWLYPPAPAKREAI